MMTSTPNHGIVVYLRLISPPPPYLLTAFALLLIRILVFVQLYMFVFPQFAIHHRCLSSLRRAAELIDCCFKVPWRDSNTYM